MVGGGRVGGEMGERSKVGGEGGEMGERSKRGGEGR